ncbi:hypothetical protein [Pedobacter sp. L105]|uniref:hypothetical protein n=1 Tax=Pedobacter sp. L105 TaxID=1641871 RepID=UPI00131BD181|nr:hypothetical protein [Pedobacter sp. L105]
MTVKEISAALVAWFNSHLQINSVTQYDNKNFIGDRAKLYTVANVYYLDSSINGQVRTDSYQVTIADLLTPGNTNESDIYFTALDIAEDFYTYLQFNPSWTFNKSSNSQKFTEADGDRIAGLTFTVQLQSIRTQNRCAIPLNDIPTTIPKKFPYAFPISFGNAPVIIESKFPYAFPVEL